LTAVLECGAEGAKLTPIRPSSSASDNRAEAFALGPDRQIEVCSDYSKYGPK